MRRGLLVLLFVICAWPVFSQDQTPVQTALPGITETITPTASLTPTFTATFTPTVTFTATATLTPTAEGTASVTPQPTTESTVDPTPELTPELTPEVTSALTEVPTEEVTLEQTAEMTPEVTAEITEIVVPSLTPTPPMEQPEATAALPSPTPTPLLSVTPTVTPGGAALRFVQGVVTYQNRETQIGIRVQITAEDGSLVSVGDSNAAGVYSLPAPADAPYRIIAEAPLHLRVVQLVPEGQVPAAMVLRGGDLNADGCIAQEDIDVILLAFDGRIAPSAADITGDGITDLADLAILTGNFDAACEPAPETTEISSEVTPEAEVTAEPQPEQTAEPAPPDQSETTAMPEQTSEATPEVEGES